MARTCAICKKPRELAQIQWCRACVQMLHQAIQPSPGLSPEEEARIDYAIERGDYGRVVDGRIVPDLPGEDET